MTSSNDGLSGCSIIEKSSSDAFIIKFYVIFQLVTQLYILRYNTTNRDTKTLEAKGDGTHISYLGLS